jgi:hypothetical protein
MRLKVNTRRDGPHLGKMFGARLERREDEAVEKPDEWDVLPDAVPFLQEILEDDDQTVEAGCRDFIQQLPMMLE